MKFASILFFAVVLLPGVTAAQPAAEAPEASAPLPAENLNLIIKGTMPGGLPADFTFAMAGGKLDVRQQLAEVELNGVKNPIPGNFLVTLSKIGENYRLSYRLGLNFPTLSGTSAVVYRPAAISGAVIIQSGKPVVIFDNNGKTLSLTLTKAGN